MPEAPAHTPVSLLVPDDEEEGIDLFRDAEIASAAAAKGKKDTKTTTVESVGAELATATVADGKEEPKTTTVGNTAVITDQAACVQPSHHLHQPGRPTPHKGSNAIRRSQTLPPRRDVTHLYPLNRLRCRH